jgi:hypothetical protein
MFVSSDRAMPLHPAQSEQEQGSREDTYRDGRLYCPTVVVWIEAGDQLDPVRPNHRENRKHRTEETKPKFYPEALPKMRDIHHSPKRCHQILLILLHQRAQEFKPTLGRRFRLLPLGPMLASQRVTRALNPRAQPGMCVNRELNVQRFAASRSLSVLTSCRGRVRDWGGETAPVRGSATRFGSHDVPAV